MRGIIRHADKYIILLLMLVCFGHILSTGTLINGYGTPIIYYLDGKSYSIEQIENMKENDEALENYLPFTACGTSEELTFTNADLGKSLTCEMIYIYGNSSQLCNATGELMADDLTGCVISSAAAWELFGETNVIGGEVLYNDKLYYVRGVYENESPVVIMQAKAAFDTDKQNTDKPEDTDNQDNIPVPGIEETGPSFDKIIIKTSNDGRTRSEYVQAFENRWGLGGNKTDCLIYQRLTTFFMMLIPSLIFLYVMFKGLYFIIINRYKPFWIVGGVLGFAVMFTAFFIICQTSPSIPVDLIPNRWSDFDFWGDMIETFKNSIQHILFMNKADIELSYFKPLVGIAGYTLIAVILFCVANVLFRIRNFGNLFTALVFTCITEMIVIYVLRQTDLILGSKFMLLYLWPYMLIGKYIFHSEKELTSEK